MGKSTGFIEVAREVPKKRDARDRTHDHHEIGTPFAEPVARAQASRCMDCGVPFCHEGCPLGNRIPDFNDLVYRGDWERAADRLAATNNFPEFTGRLCPAPCEAACVLALHGQPVTIKELEREIADRTLERSLLPIQSARRTDRRVAVVGSGPAGLACAQELARRGHAVTVIERADRVGGLLRYGIPDFKMDKSLVDRRVAQMTTEGVVFKTGIEVGVDLSVEALEHDFDAICIAVGTSAARELPIAGRALDGVHLAMRYLTEQNRINAGDTVNHPLDARGKDVVILGGGDTGADCLGTAHRQGARSVTSLEIAERPPEARASHNPWPLWPRVFKLSPADEEGGERAYGLETLRFEGGSAGDRVTALSVVSVREKRHEGGVAFERIAGSERTIPADLVLIAAGFTGPEGAAWFDQLGLERDARGNVKAGARGETSNPKVFAAGDARRGASLVVWAIADGRRAAQAIHESLVGPKMTRLSVLPGHAI